MEAAASALVLRGIEVAAVTNSLAIAQKLSGSPAIQFVGAGGSIRKGSLRLTGEPGQSFQNSFHADAALIGAHAITPPVFTGTTLDVAAMKRRMISAARRVIVRADSSRFSNPSFGSICEAAEIDEVIADEGAPGSEMAAVSALYLKCTVVPSAQKACCSDMCEEEEASPARSRTGEA